jgi:O-antigen/teichoic acid export membrane protein
MSLPVWLRRAEVDRAVVWSIAARALQALLGPLTLVLIARTLSPALQGYYYTFASLVALQSFVELGLSVVIVNVASHEWGSLRLDPLGRIDGDVQARSRLVSLGRVVFRWYAAASMVFILAVGAAGLAFFSQGGGSEGEWRGPWMAQVVLAGLSLCLLPATSILEGCNQVASIQFFRFLQALGSTAAMWTALLLGAGLWAGVVSAAVLLLRDLSLVLIRYRRFFVPFLKPPEAGRMDWKTEIWPMQWRLAVSGLFGYLVFSLFNPVMFRYHGAVVAGQMGMTLALTNVLQAIAGAWVQTRVPSFGILVAKRDFQTLDRSFFKLSAISIGVMVSGLAALWFGVAALRWMGHPLADRVLPPLPFGLFLAAAAILQVSLCETLYLRAHRQEPLLGLSVFMGTAVGGCTFLLGSRYGPVGAAAGYLAVVVICTVWETGIWFRCRREWHQPLPAPGPAGNV